MSSHDKAEPKGDVNPLPPTTLVSREQEKARELAMNDVREQELAELPNKDGARERELGWGDFDSTEIQVAQRKGPNKHNWTNWSSNRKDPSDLASNTMNLVRSNIRKNGGKMTEKELYFISQWLKEKDLLDTFEGVDDLEGNIDQSNLDKLKDITKDVMVKDTEMMEEVDTLDFQRTIFSFLAGAFLAYCILLVWIGSTLFFIISLEELDCATLKTNSEEYSDLLSGLDIEKLFDAIDAQNVTAETRTLDVKLGESDFFKKMENCQELFDRDYGFILNITFGLVTAAVVAQLGSSKSNSKSSLNKRFEPYMLSYLRSVEIRKYELEFMELGGANMVVSRCDRFQLNVKVWILYFVLWAPRIYVFCWILLGLGCLLYGSFHGESIAGPIFSIGQTWLGVAMTTTYVFFGVNKGDESDEDDDSEKKSKSISTEDDKETVLSAVKSNGMVLQYASADLRADREVVEAAVASSGMALQYASNALKNDPEVVLAAVKSNGMSLEHASNKCRRNKTIIEAASKTHPGALMFVSLEDSEESEDEAMASNV